MKHSLDIEFDEAVKEFVESQQPLGEPFTNILFDNLGILYESDTRRFQA